MARLHDLSALEQAGAIKSKEISPVELAQHYLQRIDKHNETVGAFITVTVERALDEARAAEKAVVDGDDLPLLHGVPTGIKDLNNVKGERTTFGSVLMKDFIAPYDDFVVEKLRAGGMISLGKTNTPEFGFPCYTINDVAPVARTPWNLDRLAAGSSGGAAAAVAAGLIPMAQGSDGGGSVRSPASACGLVGIKTSRGRISGGPLRVDPAGLGVTGPLALTVRDAAAFLDIASGPGIGDPYWAPPLPDGESFLGHCDRDPGTLRIGRYIDPVIPGAQADPEVIEAWEKTCAFLESLGHTVEDVPPPIGPEVIPHFVNVWSLGAATIPVTDEQAKLMKPLTQWLRQCGLALSGREAMDSHTQIGLAARRAIEQYAPYDVVVAPVCTQVPRPIDWYDSAASPEEDFERQMRYSAYTSPYNVTGQPAISLPLHQSDDGLPIGIMFVGRPADEATLVSLSAQIESAAPWRDKHPDIWEA